MGKAGRERVLVRYDWSVVSKSYLALWGELNEMASGLAVPTKVSRLQRPEYFANFKHFASVSLTGNERILLSPSGHKVLTKKSALIMHAEFAHFLNQSVIHKVLSSISGKKPPLTVAQLQSLVAKQSQIDAEDVLAYVLWLLKYGYVQIAPAN